MTDSLAARGLNLPTSAGLSEQDVERVVITGPVVLEQVGAHVAPAPILGQLVALQTHLFAGSFLEPLLFQLTAEGGFYQPLLLMRSPARLPPPLAPARLPAMVVPLNVMLLLRL